MALLIQTGGPPSQVLLLAALTENRERAKPKRIPFGMPAELLDTHGLGNS